MPQVVASVSEFESVLSEHELVIVDFHATWCGPCKMIAPKYEAFSNTYTKLHFIKLDVDEVPEVAEKAEVRAMPTFQIYKNGQKVEEIVGADPAKLEAAIKKYA
ncbi:Cytoplasmic thioredoxin isoenzyme 2 [Kappamyces sp. JEL0829]|nr:Cytoplasmic thioredoxin isoenzyme 2 [Kappamyces sp. JEL0829]